MHLIQSSDAHRLTGLPHNNQELGVGDRVNVAGFISDDDRNRLKQHPAEAAELRPLLMASVTLERGRELGSSPVFKSRARAELKRHMQANPRMHPVRGRLIDPTAWRVALSVMVLLVALMISGTAYAQTAVPGDSFYNWKITSERAWRAISQDHVGIDLALADRRVHEYMSVASDPVRSKKALDGYGEVLVRLKSETDEGTRGRIVPVLEGHESSLKGSGINIPELDDYLKGQGQDANTGLPAPAAEKPSLPMDAPAAVPTPGK